MTIENGKVLDIWKVDGVKDRDHVAVFHRIALALGTTRKCICLEDWEKAVLLGRWVFGKWAGLGAAHFWYCVWWWCGVWLLLACSSSRFKTRALLVGDTVSNQELVRDGLGLMRRGGVVV